MIKKISIVLSLLLSSPLLLSAQDGYLRDGAADIQRYSFHLVLSDESDRIEGMAQITVLFSDARDTLALDLVSEREGKGMRVEKVEYGGSEIEFSHRNDRLTLHFGKAVEGLQELKVYYSGVPANGLIIGENMFGDRTFFGDNWPNRARNWLPTVDHPSDKSAVEFHVTAPARYTVIGNGTFAGEELLPDGRKLTRWVEDVPIATKITVIGAAEFSRKVYGMHDRIPVSAWVYPQNAEAGFGSYATALPILRFFDHYIGDYPYLKLANVQSKTMYGGMENASNIFYSEASVGSGPDVQYLVAHEIAHQWFGNAVTEGNWHHLWLSEGFATFFTHLYAEYTYGRDMLEERLKADRQVVIDFSKERYTPIIDREELDPWALLNRNVYQKGGWVLHMLRERIGREAFLRGIRTYYRDFRNGNALSSDFRRIMESASGEDLGEFFRQWLEQPGHPLLEITSEVNRRGKLTLHVSQQQEHLFTFPLEVSVITSEGTVERTFPVSERRGKFEWELEGEIQEIIIDPHTRLLYEVHMD